MKAYGLNISENGRPITIVSAAASMKTTITKGNGVMTELIFMLFVEIDIMLFVRVDVVLFREVDILLFVHVDVLLFVHVGILLIVRVGVLLIFAIRLHDSLSVRVVYDGGNVNG
jgi:hypothetical protein